MPQAAGNSSGNSTVGVHSSAGRTAREQPRMTHRAAHVQGLDVFDFLPAGGMGPPVRIPAYLNSCPFERTAQSRR